MVEVWPGNIQKGQRDFSPATYGKNQGKSARNKCHKCLDIAILGLDRARACNLQPNELLSRIDE